MRQAYKRFSGFLDQKFFVQLVRLLTSRFVIILTLLLLFPLLALNDYSSGAWFVWLLNSYLNVTSLVVSSIVLLLTKIAEDKREQIAERQEAQRSTIAERQEAQRKTIAEKQERRSTEDHRRILEMHQTLFQEIETFKKLLAHIEEIRPELYYMRQLMDNIQQRQAALENRVNSIVNQMVEEVSDAVEEAVQEALQEVSETELNIGFNGNGQRSLDSASAEI